MTTPEYVHTRCEVIFHSDTGFDGTITSDRQGGLFQGKTVLGHLVSVTTSKTFGNASGTFSITIKKPPNLGPISWANQFPDPEGTWVRIIPIIEGIRQPLLWGMVDSINESIQRQDQGARAETYTITGRDFGKVFEDTKTIVNLFAIANLDIFAGLLQAFNVDPPIGPPDQVIRKVLKLWLGNNGLASRQYRFPTSLKKIAGAEDMYETLNLGGMQRMDKGHGETIDMSVLNPDQQSGQALWDVLQQYSNGLINEMWVDLALTSAIPTSGFRTTAFEEEVYLPTFYLRERRFRTEGDTSLWDNTTLIDLPLNMVRNRQLAKGGAANRYNYWLLHGGVLGDQYKTQALTQSIGKADNKPGSIPIINLQSMQRHGIRPYVVTTNFLPFFKEAPAEGEDADGNRFIRLAANWMKRVHDWYGVAPYQLSGQLTLTRLRPDIRIGHRVREKRVDGDITYYVEGVDHAWSYPGAGVTTLTVTHGQYDKADPTPLEILYADYERATLTSAALTDATQNEGPQPVAAQSQANQGNIVTDKEKKETKIPGMTDTIGSEQSRHANRIAKGETTRTLPEDFDRSSPQGTTFPQKDLEDGRDANIAEPLQYKAPEDV